MSRLNEGSMPSMLDGFYLSKEVMDLIPHSARFETKTVSGNTYAPTSAFQFKKRENVLIHRRSSRRV